MLPMASLSPDVRHNRQINLFEWALETIQIDSLGFGQTLLHLH